MKDLFLFSCYTGLSYSDLTNFEIKTENGDVLDSMEAVAKYLINEANLAIVPFYAFGAPKSSNWFRLSVGTAQLADIDAVKNGLKNA